MEARIARLEADVGHIRTDMADVKTDVRRLDSKIDTVNTALTAKIDQVYATLLGRTDDLKDSLASAKVWALVLYIALAGGLFGTLARGFGWL